MMFRYTTGAIAALAVGALATGSAFAQDTVKIGLIVSMTGQQASTGKQIKAAVDLYMKEHGDTVAGKKIQVILRDSASVPDNTKRLRTRRAIRCASVAFSTGSRWRSQICIASSERKRSSGAVCFKSRPGTGSMPAFRSR